MKVGIRSVFVQELSILMFFPKVKNVRIVRDKLTKFSKGFAYVLFANRGDVKKALQKLKDFYEKALF